MTDDRPVRLCLVCHHEWRGTEATCPRCGSLVATFDAETWAGTPGPSLVDEWVPFRCDGNKFREARKDETQEPPG